MSAYSKVERVIAALTRRIEQGEFQPGQRLPSGRELAAEYDVSMMTIRTATERLKASGVIVGVPGSGYYVPGGDGGET